MPEVRPSALPKLAECRCYQGAPTTSPEAARGTRLDGIIRAAWQGEPVPEDLVQEDAEAVQWALTALASLHVGGDKAEVFTDEEQLRAVVPVDGIQPGTMDACCPSQQWLADFKTGQMRDYEAQMAAYSLACMEEYWAEEWVAHLLFVDQMRVVTHRFTRERAEALVRGIVAAEPVARCCDYCSWCARFESCPAVKAAADEVTAPELPEASKAALSRGELPPVMEALVEDEAAAHDFLNKLKLVNDWAALLKDKLKEKLQDGESKYFSLRVSPGRRVVNALSLGFYAMELGTQRMLGMCSPIPLKKVEEAWAEVFPGKEVPEDIIVRSGTVVSLVAKKISNNDKPKN